MFLLILAACVDLEQLGVYSCDEYCEQVLDKTEECAAEADAELAEYASTARDDWAGKERADMVASCQADVVDAGKTDTECQAETGTINNLTCDQILDVLSGLASAAQ